MATALAHRVASWSSGFLHLLFPRLCGGCRKPLMLQEEIICLRCESFLSRTGYHHISNNETALRVSGRIAFRHATSFAYFTSGSLIQQLVHRLKYEGRSEYGTYLGRQLGLELKELNWEVDIVVPVPLHKRKKAARGYNQSACIAKGLAAALNVPLIEKAVIRTRFTESQTSKTREQRLQNVREAFTVQDTDNLRNRHILLVDDVLTTGATLEACSAAILSVPGTTLSIATIGIAN